MTTGETRTGNLSPAEISANITFASEPFNFPIGEVGLHNFYIGNDSGLGVAYANLGASTPDIGEAQPITLFVGHAGFETATLHMPAKAIGLFCDRDPLTLATQKVQIELIKRCSTLAEFDTAEAEFLQWLADNMPIPVAGTYGSRMRKDYSRQFYNTYMVARRESWNASSGDLNTFERHFLSDNEQYVKVRERIYNTDFAFFRIDFNNFDVLRRLSSSLKRHGCEITQANLTNVLSGGYAGENSEGILYSLPWHEDAACLTSHLDGYVESTSRSISELRVAHRKHQLEDAESP